MGRMSRVKEVSRTTDPRNLQAFVDAASCHMTGTLTETSGAAGDIGIQITGAATTHYVVVPIGVGMLVTADTADTARGEVTRGPRINSLVPVYRLITANETSITPSLETTTFADGGTLTTTDRPITGTLGNANHATNFNADTLTVTTPFVITSGMRCTLSIVLVNPGTALFEFHGCYVNYDLLL